MRLLIVSFAAVCVSIAVLAQDNPNRKEAKRADFGGAPAWRSSSSVVEAEGRNYDAAFSAMEWKWPTCCKGTQVLRVGAKNRR